MIDMDSDSSNPLSSYLQRTSRVRATITSEQEKPHGWTFEVTLRTPKGESQHSVTMSWRDHDYWCGGSIAPSRVACAVVEYLAIHMQGEIPTKFDAATSRRWTPHIDKELAETM